MSVEKVFQVGDATLVARYDETTGEFAFGKKATLANDYLTLLQENAFGIMQQLQKASEGMYMPTICFQATGMTKRETRVKDRFYSRILEQRGYQRRIGEQATLKTTLKRGLFSGVWRGPYRTYDLQERVMTYAQ